MNAQDLSDTTIIIGEVKVSAYRVSGKVQTTPGSISVLSGSELRLSRGLDFSALINTVPGITMQSGTLTTNRIVIRGMGSRTPYNTNRIRAYLNEIPVTSSDGISTPEELDIQSLGRIEIIKGPSSALYGSGLGGSINMHTPTGTKNSIDAGVQYGSFNTVRAQLSGTFRNRDLILWGNLGHTASEGYRENNKYRRTTMIATTRLEKTKWSLNTTLLLMGVFGEIPSSIGKTQFENTPWQASSNWLAIKGYKEYSRAIVAVNLKNNFTTKLSADAIVFGKWNNNYEKRPFNNLDDQSASAGFRYKITFTMPKAEWISGTEIINEDYSWKLDLNGNVINRNSETRNHFNAFTMLFYKPVRQLNISFAGALNYVTYRLTDNYPGNDDQSGTRIFPLVFSPRMGINYAPGDHVAVYASAGHGFSLPSPEETLLPAGDVNRDIRPEQGIQYEAGIRISPKRVKMEADAAVYLIDLKDLLVTKRLTEDIFTGINAGRTKHHGFELLLKTVLFDSQSFPGKLSSTLSYTGSINKFIDFTDNGITYDGKSLPGIPSQSLQVQLNWNTFRIFELYSRLQYAGKQFLTDNNVASASGYVLADMKAAAHVNMKKQHEMSVYTGINNITGTNYASMIIANAVAFGNNEPRYYYPGMPRSWYAGISISF